MVTYYVVGRLEDFNWHHMDLIKQHRTTSLVVIPLDTIRKIYDFSIHSASFGRIIPEKIYVT
jgi:hypothetical protein